jgi:hypothetical protein
VTPRGGEEPEARARRGHHQPGGLAAGGRRSVSPPNYASERKKEADLTQTTSATLSDDASETDASTDEDAAGSSARSSKQLDDDRNGRLVNEAIGLRIMQAQTADEILQVAVEDGYRFEINHCARCLGRLADCKKAELEALREDKRWKKILSRLRAIVEAAAAGEEVVKPARLSACLCNMVRLGLRDKVFLRTCPEVILIYLYQFSLSDLSNTLWAFAKAGVCNFDLFDAAADRVVAILPDGFKPGNCAMLAWAFAKADIRSERLFGAMAERSCCEKIMAGLTAQELSNLVWSYAKLGHSGEEIYKHAAKHGIARIAEFTTTELSNLVWAFAQASVIDEPFFRAVAQRALPMLSEFSPAQQYNLLWGFMIAFSRDSNIYHCGCGRVLVRI